MFSRNIVSNCLTFFLSMLCCQCFNFDAMPLSNSPSNDSKPSFEDYQIIPQNPVIEAERASGEPLRPQHLVIDFGPQAGDSPETETRCHEFWQFVHSRSELAGMRVNPEPLIDDWTLRETPSRPSSPLHCNGINHDNFPAIHAIMKLQNKGDLSTALAGTACLKR